MNLVSDGPRAMNGHGKGVRGMVSIPHYINEGQERGNVVPRSSPSTSARFPTCLTSSGGTRFGDLWGLALNPKPADKMESMPNVTGSSVVIGWGSDEGPSVSVRHTRDGGDQDLHCEPWVPSAMLTLGPARGRSYWTAPQTVDYPSDDYTYNGAD